MLDWKNSNKVRRGSVWMAHLAVGGLLFLLGFMIFRSVAPASPEVFLPGTALTVRLARPVTSRDTQLGDSFEGWVDSAQEISGATHVLHRARVEGRCVAVRAGDADGHPGYLRLALSGLWDAHGHFASLETTTVSMSGKSALAAPPRHKNDPEASGRDPAEVVITPEVSLTFVLLKPVVIPGRHWAP